MLVDDSACWSRTNKKATNAKNLDITEDCYAAASITDELHADILPKPFRSRAEIQE